MSVQIRKGSAKSERSVVHMVACFHTINLQVLHIQYVCSEMPKSALRYLGSNWGLCKCQHIYHVALAPHYLKPQQRIYLLWVCVWIQSCPQKCFPKFLAVLDFNLVLINIGGILVPLTKINLGTKLMNDL